MSVERQNVEVLTLSESGTPESRITDASAAHRLVSAFEREDMPRSQARAKTRGMLDGNPPYRPSELKRLGQSHRTNLNFREAEGYVTARRSSYYDLVMDSPRLVNVSLVPTKMAKVAEVTSDDTAPTRFADIISQEYHDLLTGWGGFLFHTMRQMNEMINYGIGPTFFPDEHDWRFRSALMADVLVPSDAPANVTELEVVALRSSYRVTELYDLIRDPEQTEASREAGWNVTLIRDAIVKSYDNVTGLRSDDWETVQASIRSNSLVEAYAGPKPVMVYQLFWKEFSGRISMGIILRDAQESRFLYRSIGRFEDMGRVLNLFFSNIGDGTYHSVRGLGVAIFPHCEVSNRFLNTMIDGAQMAAGVVVRQQGGGALTVPRLMRVGPITVLPREYDPMDKGFNPNLQGVAEVRSIIQNNLNSNVGLFRPGAASTPDGAIRTAREVTTDAQKEARLESTDISFYYLQWDRLYTEQLRRALDPDYPSTAPGYEEAKAFIKRCVERGVPRSLLQSDSLKVKATRSIGAGSPVMKDINSRELLQLAPYLDRKGKYEAIRNRVLVLAGPENMQRFVGDMDRNSVPVVDTSVAHLESGMMKLGEPASAGSGQDHTAHLAKHLEAIQEYGAEIAGAAQQGAEPDFQSAARYAQLVLEHCIEHLEFLQGNPAFAEEVAEFTAALRQVEQLAKRWQGMAEKQAQAQAQAQQAQQEQLAKAQSVDADIEKERIRAEADLKLRIHKEERNHEVRSAKAVHGMQLAEARVQHEIQREDIKVEADLRRKENTR